jgi:hypothetical protein
MKALPRHQTVHRSRCQTTTIQSGIPEEELLERRSEACKRWQYYSSISLDDQRPGAKVRRPVTRCKIIFIVTSAYAKAVADHPFSMSYVACSRCYENHSYALQGCPNRYHRILFTSHSTTRPIYSREPDPAIWSRIVAGRWFVVDGSPSQSTPRSRLMPGIPGDTSLQEDSVRHITIGAPCFLPRENSGQFASRALVGHNGIMPCLSAHKQHCLHR